MGGIALACSDEPTAVHVIPPSEVIREFANGCHVDATETTFGSDSSQVLVTFEGGWERCYPALAAYGIDMADPLGVDTPQGDMRWQIAEADHVANAPSGTDAATTYLTGDRIMIEFDPPVRSVEFHYSRLTPDGAYWGGVWSSTDSMPVYAMSRTPGTTTYQTYDREVLYSNVPSALPPWSVWDYARLDAPGDYIEWLWFDGDAAIDDLKITRLTVPDTGFSVTVQCSPSPVVRGQTVTCEASWTPTSIQASEIAFAWEFQGDSIKVFPDPTAGGFEPPAPVDSSGTGMDSWSGPAVLGGTVALTGTWDGRVDTDSTELVVNARSGPEWGDLPTNLDTVPFRDIPTDSTVPLQQQPSPIAGDPTLGLMGLNLDSIAGFAGTDPMIRFAVPPAISIVPSGPNRGLAYISSPGDMRATRTVALRTWITGREKPKFRYTCVTDTLTNRGLLQAMRANKSCGGNYKHRPDSAAFVNGVVAHETYGSGGGRGHQGQIELAAASLPTCGRVPTIIERVIAVSAYDADQLTAIVLGEGRQSLWAATEHYFVYGNFDNVPFYQVVDSVTVVDHSYAYFRASGDAQAAQPSQDNQPDPRYKCTRSY